MKFHIFFIALLVIFAIVAPAVDAQRRGTVCVPWLSNCRGRRNRIVGRCRAVFFRSERRCRRVCRRRFGRRRCFRRCFRVRVRRTRRGYRCRRRGGRPGPPIPGPPIPGPPIPGPPIPGPPGPIPVPPIVPCAGQCYRWWRRARRDCDLRVCGLTRCFGRFRRGWTCTALAPPPAVSPNPPNVSPPPLPSKCFGGCNPLAIARRGCDGRICVNTFCKIVGGVKYYSCDAKPSMSPTPTSSPTPSMTPSGMAATRIVIKTDDEVEKKSFGSYFF